MKIVSDSVVDKTETYILCSITLPENGAVFKIMWEKIW
jgi:hypothetical protein